MAGVEVPTLTTDNQQDFRVHVKSKKIVVHQLEKYKSLLMKLLERQPEMKESDVETILQEMLTNFEVAVQENISDGGFSWEQATEEPRGDVECSLVDDLLDEKIVQTTWKRSVYPKKILPYFVRSLKAERKLMGLMESTVTPQEVKRDPAQDAIMSSVSTAAPSMFSQAATVMKSLKDVKQMAEGLQQALDTPLSPDTLEVYRDVFSADTQRPVLQHINTHSIRRAVTETHYSRQYLPLQQ